LKNQPAKNILPTILALAASAAMLTVIQPPIGWAFLAWVSFVPFILACSPHADPRRLVKITYVISLCYWLGNLYWVWPVTIVGWAAFCLYTAFLWPTLALCIRYCRTKNFPLFLAVPILIVAIEQMQGLFLGGFFWRFLAHSQYQNIALIQIADIFGAGGVSFLIAMFNGLLAELIIGQESGARSQGKVLSGPRTPISVLLAAILVCAAIVAAFTYGRWRIAQSDKFVEEGPLVASLQSNVPQSVKRTFSAENEIFDALMEQSKAATETGAELIIWPETMVQAILDSDVWPFLISAEECRAFDKALREHSEKTAFVLVGAYGGSIQQDSDGGISLARYNSAFLYRPDGQQDGRRYDKIHLVPFGEVLPLRKIIPSFYRMLMKVKFIPYNFDYSLDYGSEYTVFEMTGSENKEISHEDTKSQSQSDISKKQKNSSGLGVLVAENNRIYKFGVMICYEDTVPAIARRFALDKNGQKQVDWLVNISNDGWFVKFEDAEVSSSAELPQHAAVCAFRAVENRLPIVRSVNTGISCLIDSLGCIKDGFRAGTLPRKAMARTGVAGWFTDRILIDKRTTFFSKNGEWLDFCCEGCVILLIIVWLFSKIFKK
jgi:apolipoprotein N-acyltransferase